MSDNLDGSGSCSSQPIPTADVRSGAPQVTISATDRFSSALQQFAVTPPNTSRGTTSIGWLQTSGARGRHHVECDSDGFVDSDDEGDEADGRGNGAKSSSSSTSSSDSAWDTFRGGEPQLARCRLGKEASGDTDDEYSDDGVLFVPEPIFDLRSLQHKPIMPCLSQDQMPIGISVWVVDEDDVATQLQCYFSAAYPPVCNGRLSGTVVRHSGRMTLVCFNQASELRVTLCIPTSCLSLELIEPYESAPQYREPYRLGSGVYGMLGPRAGGRGQTLPAGDTVVVTRYLYEAMPAYDVEKLRGTALEKAQELFFEGSYEKALAAVNEQLAEIRSSCDAGSSAPRKHSTLLVDAFVLRSRLFIFLERYAEALVDAHTSVTLEPQWVRSHLSVARAHCGLGQFIEAAAAISRAYIMLPYSSDLERIKELNCYMQSLQSQLRAEQAGCYLILDGFYRKRLRVNVNTAAGVSLCKEMTPIVATHSVFAAKEPAQRCVVCFRALNTTADGDSEARSVGAASVSCSEPARMSPTTVGSPALTTPVVTDLEENSMYCSTECVQRASLYRPLEIKHRGALDHIRSMILSKGAVTLNVLPLEMAMMAVRLFLMVVTTHRRLCAKRRLGESNQRGAESTRSRGAAEKEVDSHFSSSGMRCSCNLSPSPPVYVETALQRLGVYPLCTEPLKSNKLDELKIVYNVLTADFKTEDRSTFSCELLTQLFSYVNAYFTPVDLNARLPPDASEYPAPHHTVYYLPNYVGCIEVAKKICYTTTSSRCDFSSLGAAEAAEDQLTSKVIGPLALDEPVETSNGNKAKKNESFTLTIRDDEANCTVLPASNAALLELIAVAPITPDLKLRCVPTSMILNSELA
ncbi:hypothetical protein ABL78_6853 [Leptomonas seymouri]|uniref:Uncharacterized protein n=1 Tax=Leptomonas seymouri TaxID=5684 RepID=A0A0N0P3V6_LEPSE|nr:hypothetical protein ABL78_6853 [Leptomonas seymouri]|eukprot:KPI84097.1 hypothetical protein ABL78_6853 [Leptomonas seymouri]